MPETIHNTEMIFKHTELLASIPAQISEICNKILRIEKSIEQRFEENKERINLAREQMERRLEGMNEFRAQLTEQTRTFVNRKELDLIVQKLETRFELLGKGNRERIEQLEKEYAMRKGSQIWETVIITAMVSATIIVVAHFLFKF